MATLLRVFAPSDQVPNAHQHEADGKSVSARQSEELKEIRMRNKQHEANDGTGHVPGTKGNARSGDGIHDHRQHVRQAQ